MAHPGNTAKHNLMDKLLKTLEKNKMVTESAIGQKPKIKTTIMKVTQDGLKTLP